MCGKAVGSFSSPEACESLYCRACCEGGSHRCKAGGENTTFVWTLSHSDLIMIAADCLVLRFTYLQFDKSGRHRALRHACHFLATQIAALTGKNTLPPSFSYSSLTALANLGLISSKPFSDCSTQLRLYASTPGFPSSNT